MARKRHLLDVLREQENRSTGVTPEAPERPQRPSSGGEELPPWLIPGVGGALILALLIWGGCQLLGGGGAGEEDPVDEPVSQVEDGPFGVLAVVYDPSMVEEAKKMGRALQTAGYNVQLAQVPVDDGKVQLQLFVGSESSAQALEPLLQEIQALSLEGQPQPFAGARIEALPKQ